MTRIRPLNATIDLGTTPTRLGGLLVVFVWRTFLASGSSRGTGTGAGTPLGTLDRKRDAEQWLSVIESEMLRVACINPHDQAVHEAMKAGLSPVPSRSGIYRALLRAGLIDPGARRPRDRRWKRWERARPMELWQMDIVGGMGLADGGELKILTGVDDHSRYCVVAAVMRRATGRAVCQAFTSALTRHGVPEEILTDNGKQFTGRFNRPPVEVLFDRICRENGIEHALTKPRSPTTTGKIERFHRSLREELLTGQVFPDPAAAGGVGRVGGALQHHPATSGHRHGPPHERFWRREQAAPGPAERPLETSAMAPEQARQGEAWVARRVGANGVICVSWQQFSVGKHHAGANVDVHVGPELLHVYLADTLIKTIVRTSRGEVRKKRASVPS